MIVAHFLLIHSKNSIVLIMITIVSCLIIFQMAELLQKIREEMAQHKWDIYVLPRSDEHQSEYLSAVDDRVEFISGFTGSNGIVLISQTEALLWTDGRYFQQAQLQLFPGWQLRKMLQEVKMWFQHAIAAYPGATVGLDPRLFTAQSGQRRITALLKAGLKVDISLDNIVDKIWENRPKLQKPEIFVHQQWAGKSIQEKVGWIRKKIEQKQGRCVIFNDLSEIAWVLNLRSSQIPHNPFFKGVLIVKLEGGSLYLPHDNPSLNSETVKSHLGKVGLKVEPYEPLFEQKSLIVKTSLNYYIYSSIKDKSPIQWQGIGIYRAVRTQKQLNGFRRCHLVDGVAMAKFWSWRSKLDQVDQYEAALNLNQRRYDQPNNKGLSFETISGGGPNGAIIHYHPTEKNHSKITKDMVHLVDSGGQYLDGTTDVTRAFHFGNPTLQQKDSFTRVLLGNLDIERLRWPAGKLHGGDIDILARRHLWAVNKDYCHGTGHGVAYFGGVHEGPVGISKYNTTNFLTGMIVTNEPGYYETGKYGIRIENMLLVREENGFNWFENLTLCPYDKNLIDPTILTASDKDFINKYHQRVWETLSPSLGEDQAAFDWLKNATSPL